VHSVPESTRTGDVVAAALRPLADPRTYRGLVFLLSALVLAPLWLALLLAGWLAVGLMAVTPLVVPALVALRALTWLGARLEALLARELLGVEARVPPPSFGAEGYWGRLRILGDPRLWTQQAYLLLRMLLSSTLALAAGSALSAAAWMIAVPFSYRLYEDAEAFGWHIRSFPEALPLLPAGLVALVLCGWLVRACNALWAPLPGALLGGGPASEDARPPVALALRRALPFHATVYSAVGVLTASIWLLTTRAYFWPEWVLLPLGMLLAAHAVVVLVETVLQDDRLQALAIHAGVAAALGIFFVAIWAVTRRAYFWPEWALLPLGLALGIHGSVELADGWQPLVRLTRSRALAIQIGICTCLGAFLVCIWAVTRRGYFWPVWPIIGLAVVAFLHALVVALAAGDRVALTQRIDVLTTTRAGAVEEAQEELSRIERNLHDGAQARLVALGMSLGMAEQKLATDPESARRLLLEARSGAAEALRELRDLARGLHPPILTDRGLEAALSALASRSPLPVEIEADVPERPAAAVETAAYFVAAEALANAAKHARASHVRMRLARLPGRLEVEVHDDGAGGADAAGAGLSGVRRRVEALDGSFSVSSPAGGPTIIVAVLPCEP
jgi:signal transduction histidine kinase